MSQGFSQRMLPDAFPRVRENVAEALIIRLAGQHVAIWLEAHVVICRGAAFDAKRQKQGVKVAILGWGVPDQPLAAVLGKLSRFFQKRGQIVFFQAGLDCCPVS